MTNIILITERILNIADQNRPIDGYHDLICVENAEYKGIELANLANNVALRLSCIKSGILKHPKEVRGE